MSVDVIVPGDTPLGLRAHERFPRDACGGSRLTRLCGTRRRPKWCGEGARDPTEGPDRCANAPRAARRPKRNRQSGPRTRSARMPTRSVRAGRPRRRRTCASAIRGDDARSGRREGAAAERGRGRPRADGDGVGQRTLDRAIGRSRVACQSGSRSSVSAKSRTAAEFVLPSRFRPGWPNLLDRSEVTRDGSNA